MTNMSRRKASEQATYFCPGCHAQEKGLAHGVHCPTIGGKPPKPRAAPPADEWDDLDEAEPAAEAWDAIDDEAAE